MKKSKIWINIICIAAMISGVSVLYIFMTGWTLMFPIKVVDVASVTLADAESGVSEEYTDQEHIQLAADLMNFLNYVPFAAPLEEAGPLIEITFVFKDGSRTHVTANNTDVFLNGKGHKIKNEGNFVKMVRSAFAESGALEQSAE